MLCLEPGAVLASAAEPGSSGAAHAVVYAAEELGVLALLLGIPVDGFFWGVDWAESDSSLECERWRRAGAECVRMTVAGAGKRSQRLLT